MTPPNHAPILERCRAMLRAIVEERGLDRAEVQVLAKALSPEEAIGAPGRRDFPIVEGRERVIEAAVLGARGQAFTDSPANFEGRVRDILEIQLTDNRSRAIFAASLNAMLRALDLAQGTLHCKDDAPETCARELAAFARKSGARSVGLVGLNPAIAEALAREFGPESVRVLDLNRQNIGQKKFGVEIMDGRTCAEEMIKGSDMAFITGTTLVNGTLDNLLDMTRRGGKRAVIYGVTAAGASAMLKLTRFCPCAGD